MPESDAPKFAPELENSGNGRTVAFNKDDLVQPIRKTLGDYLAKQTAKNEFPIKEGSEVFKLHNPDGTPAELSLQDTNAKKTYMDTFDPASQVNAEFHKYSNSGYLDTNGSAFIIKKGVSNKPLPSGEDLIREVDSKLDKSSFVQRVQEVIHDNNRFNVDNPFIPRNGLGNSGQQENDSNIGIGIVQKEFGVHYPRKDLNAALKPGLAAEPPTLLKIKELKKLGALTMIRASGEVYSPKDPNDAAQDMAARGSTLIPGLARVGQKVPSSRFSARNIVADIDPNFRRPDLNNSLETKEMYSYGNANNYLVPFAGLSSVSSIVGAGLLTTVVVTMLKALSAGVIARKKTNALRHPGTVTNLIGGNMNEETLAKRHQKRLGSFLSKSGLFEFDIETTNTYHDYFKCVDRGITIFFGMEASTITPQAVSQGLTQIAKNHGFYNVILRNIIRSATDDFINSFGISLGAIAPQAQFGTSNRGFAKEDSGFLAFPPDPVGLVTKLNNSALLKFINVLAGIGDNALLLDKQGYNTASISGFDISEVSDIDKIVGINSEGEIELAAIHSKNRLSDRNNALAWNSHSTPSMYWFPKEILSGSTTFFGTSDNNVIKAMAGVADQTKSDSSINGRISPDDVAAFETKLDAEYMPFYFHDLRTNEIISFHAFLEDVSDGFTAEYEESDGYGRIGKVLTYKNTNRSIGLSFKVVSTSPEDFDQMWWKLNKLITLVYPQYTEGRRLKETGGSGGDKKFIQPFSQLPSSSPMIRLRLGDLFKTNYSKFNLARMFGVSSPWFSVSQNQQSFDASSLPQLKRSIEQTSKRMRGLASNASYRFNATEHAFLKPNGQPGTLGTIKAYAKVDSGGSAPVAVVPQELLGSNENDRGLVIYHETRVKIKEQIRGAQAYKVEVESGSPAGTFLVHDEDLVADPEEILKVASGRNSNSNPDTNTNSQNSDVNDFFADSSTANGGGNAIFRSFKAVQGKGLAGFIKSLNFDYNETTWETQRANSHAPMFVTVTLEFAPVHDLSPGIDAYGFNTAPVYNVGSILNAFNKDETANNRTQDDRVSQARNQPGQVRGNSQVGDYQSGGGGRSGIG
jgi:hypothetical protein